MQNDLLDDFTEYCRAYPEQRFWQALRNWSGANFILFSRAADHSRAKEEAKDTFYWDAKNGHRRSVNAQ